MTNEHARQSMADALDNEYQVIEDFNEPISVDRREYSEVYFDLPPSKSHLIRQLIIASLSKKKVSINGVKNAGRDVLSLKKSLINIGVKIVETGSDWTIEGFDESVQYDNIVSMDMGNSGTALRLSMAVYPMLFSGVIFSGDKSLSTRSNHDFIGSLRDYGFSVKKYQNDDNLPILVSADLNNMKSQSISLNNDKSSQPLSGWMIASFVIDSSLEIMLIGEQVSRKHALLTESICSNYGAKLELSDGSLHIKPSKLSMPDEVSIPVDTSIVSFAMLLSAIHNCKVELSNWPKQEDCLGNDLLKLHSSEMGFDWQDNKIKFLDNGSYVELDLTDSNDLITPLSFILAISSGGKISGIGHTQYKESNRLEKTIELMTTFGLKVDFENEQLHIAGNQELKIPSKVINSYNDHRLYMTSVILCTKVNGVIIGKGLHEIADPCFMSRLGIL